MKRSARFLLCCSLALTLTSSLVGVVCLYIGVSSAKWIQSAGIFCALAALFQLEVSGLFDHWMERYGDEEQYPYGPPSHITRQIIDDPDAPLRMRIKNTLFFEKGTGFRLGLASAALNLVGVWIP